MPGLSEDGLTLVSASQSFGSRVRRLDQVIVLALRDRAVSGSN